MFSFPFLLKVQALASMNVESAIFSKTLVNGFCLAADNDSSEYCREKLSCKYKLK